MFMPQQPQLTPEQKAILRQNTVSTVQSFVLFAVVLRAAPFAIDQIKKLL
ncbi:hypothetical protein DM01DRAFT_326210 [Hesseltinella vesiculosa]|uniref:Uncharacterized protein n=1 Tax=Hesseltinella vesiculosa TaxID=101127 RepID=A0A1X2GUH1_9FUNG|nr:hypothetical protein DM01DRAFT_326210 [Hesseltinella vesiculosa]